MAWAAAWAAAGSRHARSVRAKPRQAATAPLEDADLLQGVRGANQSNQSKQSGKLQQMYNKSKGGVNAGDAF